MNILYISDLDGTLLNMDIKLTEESREIINSISDKINFTFATARSADSALPLINGLNLNLPYVLHNGVLVVDPANKECVYKRTIEFETAHEIINIFKKNGMYPLVYTYSSVSNGNKVLYHAEQSEFQHQYVRDREENGDRRFSIISTNDEINDVITIVGLGCEDELLEIRKELNNIPDIHIEFSKDLYHDHYWLEITHAKATKYYGVKALQKYLGAEKLVCFGDNYNDTELFKACDYCIAVSNAVEPLKSMADKVIGSNNENAVAKYLQALYTI